MVPLRWLLVVPLYGVACALGLAFYFDPEQIATFWPASGIYMGLLVLCPARHWPVILLLASLGQLSADSLLAQRPLAMNGRTAAQLPPILVDRGQIEQVVMNLAINARDAMPTGGRLEIETSLAVAPVVLESGAPGASRGFVQLRVADSGQGIAADVLPHVFEPFFTTKRLGEGTGLGLATVHAIATQNDGLVEIRSIEHEGTEVFVRLPAMGTPAAPSGGVHGPTPAVGGHERILVCEDEPGLWQVLQRSLVEAGYEVLLARDVREALRIAGSQDRLDVLVTDVVMPGLSGPALAKSVREIHAGLRVLFISGYPADMPPDTGTEFVASALLSKPFRPDELRVRVRALIDAQPFQ